MKKLLLFFTLLAFYNVSTGQIHDKKLSPTLYLKLNLGKSTSLSDTVTFRIMQKLRTDNFLYLKVRFDALSQYKLYCINLETKESKTLDSVSFIYQNHLEIFKIQNNVYAIKSDYATKQTSLKQLNGLKGGKSIALPSDFTYYGIYKSTKIKNVYLYGKTTSTGQGIYAYNFESEKLRLVYQTYNTPNQLMTFGDSLCFYDYRERSWYLGYGASSTIKLGKYLTEWGIYKNRMYRKDSTSNEINLMKSDGITVKESIYTLPSNYKFKIFDTIGNYFFVAFYDTITKLDQYFVLDPKTSSLSKSFSCTPNTPYELVALGNDKIVQFIKVKSTADTIIVYNIAGKKLYNYALDSLWYLPNFKSYGYNFNYPQNKKYNGELLFTTYSKNYNFSLATLSENGDKLTFLSKPFYINPYGYQYDYYFFQYNKELYTIGKDSSGVIINKLSENNITLNVKFYLDENADSTYNNGEFLMTTMSLEVAKQKLLVDDKNSTFYLELDSYTVKPVVPAMWKISGPATIFINPFEKNDRIFNINIGLVPAKEKLKITGIVSGTPTRCGFKTWVRPKIINSGNTLINGSITLNVDTLAKIDSFSRIPDETVNNTYTWYFENIQPTDFRAVKVYLQMPSAKYRGTNMNFDSYFKGFVDNEDTVYTNDTTRKELSCSYDPNDKTVWPQRTQHNDQTLFDEPLIYRIRFQNTGTDTAFNIVVADTISKHLNLKTFKILDFSHPLTTKIYDNGVVEFHFDNILLPDSNVNEAESHGFVTYTIEADSGLNEQTEIKNTAYIYFDFNEAIITNTTRNIMVSEIVGVGPGLKANLLPINFFPNPSNKSITVELKEIGSAQISIYNIEGKLIQSINTQNQMLNMDISGLPNGLYLIKVNQNGHSFHAKLIKE